MTLSSKIWIVRPEDSRDNYGRKRMMKFEKIKNDIAKITNEGEPLLFGDLSSAMDLIGNAWGEGDCQKLILMKGDIAEVFFDLKTKVAGEIIQKFINYNFRVAIVGDFSGYTSKSLNDFIRESNKGGSLLFVDTVEDAVDKLS